MALIHLKYYVYIFTYYFKILYLNHYQIIIFIFNFIFANLIFVKLLFAYNLFFNF